MHPEQMHRKRPAESRSRGHSPPDKRVRPPERPPPMQDRVCLNHIGKSCIQLTPTSTPTLHIRVSSALLRRESLPWLLCQTVFLQDHEMQTVQNTLTPADPQTAQMQPRTECPMVYHELVKGFPHVDLVQDTVHYTGCPQVVRVVVDQPQFMGLHLLRPQCYQRLRPQVLDQRQQFSLSSRIRFPRQECL